MGAAAKSVRLVFLARTPGYRTISAHPDRRSSLVTSFRSGAEGVIEPVSLTLEPHLDLQFGN